ncbi:MAG TPA: HAMP domain-containing sensor histidine kinase [Planctomycetaceae bacterium]|nr:HAMP domain-containing sensor histidine kinase [Planctomycetaceae bacterium]
MISRTEDVPSPLTTREVLATLAHELRDPLGAVLFALETLPAAVDPDVRRAFSTVQHQARRAARIIDDLFDLCAASRDQLSLHKEVVELAAVVEGAIETTAHLLAVRGHRLTVSLTTSPMLIFADPLRLEQVLTNLLANAAKYTDPGGDIRLTADAEAGQIILRVQDNGRGIASDLLPRIFDRFWQAPGKNMASGLGLGLALVKSLVEMHGGNVAARSDGPGTGTELIVRLPDCSDDCRTIEPPCAPRSPLPSTTST